MIGGILFFIARSKLEISLEDNITQLFIEILGMSIFLGILVSAHQVGIQLLPKQMRQWILRIHAYMAFLPISLTSTSTLMILMPKNLHLMKHYKRCGIH